jgi:hypothetical protein
MYLDILHVFYTYPERVQDTFWDTYMYEIHQDTCVSCTWDTVHAGYMRDTYEIHVSAEVRGYMEDTWRIHQDTYPIGTPPQRIGNPPSPYKTHPHAHIDELEYGGLMEHGYN